MANDIINTDINQNQEVNQQQKGVLTQEQAFDLARRQKKFTMGVLNAAHEISGSNSLEANRTVSKSLLRKELLLYGQRFRDDAEYKKIIKMLFDYANHDVNDDIRSWQEGLDFNAAEQTIHAYLADLSRKDEALRKVYAEKFTTEVDGERKWVDEDDYERLEEDGTFPQGYFDHWTKTLGQKSAELDNKRAVMADLLAFIELQKDGKLNVPKELWEQEQKQASGEIKADSRPKIVNHFSEFNPQPTDYVFVDVSNTEFDRTDYSLNKNLQNIQAMTNGSDDRSANPLFPHDPTPNDIAQGGFGDCFIMASLASLAKTHPEKIKENIIENPDGKTCTVRLFAKNESGRYMPVYVKVPKKTYHFGTQNALGFGAEHCLWAAMYEQAIAASGLFSSAEKTRSNDNPSFSCSPVKPDIEEKYKELLALEKSQGKLTKNQIERYSKEYPQLFGRHKKGSIENSYYLVKWPNFNAINGGNSGVITELLLGPDAPKNQIIFNNDKNADENFCKLKESFLPKNATTPAKILAYSLISEKVPGKNANIICPFIDSIDDPAELFDKMAPHLNKEFKTNAQNEPIPTDVLKAEFCKYFNKLKENSENLGVDGPPTKDQTKRLIKDTFPSQAEKNLLPEPQKTILNTLQAACEQNNSLRDQPPYSEKAEYIFSLITEKTRRNEDITCGSREEPEGDSPNTPPSPYVFASHAYTILSTRIDEETGRKYVSLRNPWGSVPGWARKLVGADQNILVTTYDKYGYPHHSYGKDPEGIFEMELRDFLHDMDCIDFNPPNHERIMNADEIGSIVRREDTQDYQKITKNFVLAMFEVTKHANTNFTAKDCLLPTDPKVACRNIAMASFNPIVTRFDENGNMIREPLKELTPEQQRELDQLSKALYEVYTDFASTAKSRHSSYAAFPEKAAEMVLGFITGRSNDARMNTIYNKEDPTHQLKLDLLTKISAHPFAQTMKEIKDNTFKENPRTEKKWNELKKIFDKNRNSATPGRLFYDHQGSDSNYLLHTQPEEITDMFINENGEKMLTLKKGDKVRNYPFKDVLSDAAGFFNEPGLADSVLEPSDPINGLTDQERIEVNNQLNYLSFLSGLSETFAATYRKGDHSSDEYFELDKAMKKAANDIAKLDGCSTEKVAQILDGLSDKIAAYDDRCARAPKNNPRRQTRTNTVQMLKDLTQMAKSGVTDPQESIRRQNAEMLINHRDLNEKTKLNPAMKAALVDKLADSPKFKAEILHSNIYERLHPTKAQLKEQADVSVPQQKSEPKTSKEQKRSVMNK